MWFDKDGSEVGTDTPKGRLLDVKDFKENQEYVCAIWVDDVAGLRREKSVKLMQPSTYPFGLVYEYY